MAGELLRMAQMIQIPIAGFSILSVIRGCLHFNFLWLGLHPHLETRSLPWGMRITACQGFMVAIYRNGWKKIP